MSSIDLYEWSLTIGWTLFHSIWQAAITGGLIWLIFRFVSRDNARIRYALSGLGLVLICIASAITFYRYIPKSTEISLTSLPVQIGNTEIVQNEELFFSKLWTLIKLQLEHTFPFLVNIWIIGMFFLSIRLMVRYINTLKLKKHLTFSLRPKYKKVADRLVGKFKLKQNIIFRESGLLEIPSVIGYFKPIVLLPVSMLSGIPENQLEIIIAHELAHIRRHDYLLQFIQGIIELIFFYHPVVWWLSSVVNAEREHICDDLAVKVCDESLTLIKALNNMEAIRKKQYELVLGFSGKKGNLLNRIQRILRPKTALNPRVERFMLSGVFTLLFAGLFLVSNFAVSENSDSQKAFFSKINILDTPHQRSMMLDQKEILPAGLVTTESSDQKKKNKKKSEKKQTVVVATGTGIEDILEVEEEIEVLEMPPMPPLPPAVDMHEQSNRHRFHFPKDSVKSDKWVKMKADEIIKEQVQAMQEASEEMENETADFNLNEIRNELREELKKDWKKEQKEMEKQLEELSNENFMANFTKDLELQQKEMADQLKKIQENSEISESEKERITKTLKETTEKVNSVEFQENRRSQIEKSRESLKTHLEQMQSGEFEKQLQNQREAIQTQLERIESPEFQNNIKKNIEESKIKIQEYLERVNSEEYRKELEEQIRESSDTHMPSLPISSAQIENPDKQPLIIMDGKKISRKEMDQIPHENIASVNVYKKEYAIEKYGKEAKNGVIEISTKSQNLKDNVSVKLKNSSTKNAPLYVIDSKKVSSPDLEELENHIESMNVIKGDEAIEKYGEEAKNGVIEISTKSQNLKDNVSVKLKNSSTKNAPLYVIDGKKVSSPDLEELENHIESMNVIKGDMAIEKYGEEAKNGVIEISTKSQNLKDNVSVKLKNSSTKNAPLYVIDGKKVSSPDLEGLENHIESMNVIKGDEAIEKYGEEAKNGVIIITLKSDNYNSNVINELTASTTDSPIFIVDGKKISAGKVKNINSDDIDYINIIKGDEAIEKYGKKAKNGAVIIRLKK